jgi:hypothetical protein
MLLYTFLPRLLNEFVQIANKMGLHKNNFLEPAENKQTLWLLVRKQTIPTRRNSKYKITVRSLTDHLCSLLKQILVMFTRYRKNKPSKKGA